MIAKEGFKLALNKAVMAAVFAGLNLGDEFVGRGHVCFVVTPSTMHTSAPTSTKFGKIIFHRKNNFP